MVVGSIAAVGDGTYKITGNKIFISAGEHDMVPNILHLVLARLPDAPKGSKGISLFLVDAKTPGFSKGKRLEKVGMKAQDTSELFFDDVLVPCENLLGEQEGQRTGLWMILLSLLWQVRHSDHCLQYPAHPASLHRIQ